MSDSKFVRIEDLRAALRAEISAALLWHRAGGGREVPSETSRRRSRGLGDVAQAELFHAAPAVVLPHVRLWQLLERAGVVWCDRSEWSGRASDLHALLNAERSLLSRDDRRAIPAPAWIGQRLKAAGGVWGEGVVKGWRGKAGERMWTLHRRADLAA